MNQLYLLLTIFILSYSKLTFMDEVQSGEFWSDNFNRFLNAHL